MPGTEAGRWPAARAGGGRRSFLPKRAIHILLVETTLSVETINLVQSKRVSNSLRNCWNGGGRIAMSSDGRVAACVYCGSANAWPSIPARAGCGNRHRFQNDARRFRPSAEDFRETLPSETTVHESGLLFKNVTAFDVVLGEFTFRLSRKRKKLVAQRIATVRGIKLKTETMSLEAWIAALAETLAEMASASAGARGCVRKNRAVNAFPVIAWARAGAIRRSDSGTRRFFAWPQEEDRSRNS